MHAAQDDWIGRYQDVLEQALATVRAHLGWLSVRTNAERAEVSIDGAAVGAAPSAAPLRVVAGNHDIEVRAHGYVETDRTVQVAAAAQVDLFVTHRSGAFLRRR